MFAHIATAWLSIPIKAVAMAAENAGQWTGELKIATSVTGRIELGQFKGITFLCSSRGHNVFYYKWTDLTTAADCWN